MPEGRSLLKVYHLRTASQIFFLLTAILGVFGIGMTGFIYPYFFCPASPGACAGCPIWVIEHGTLEIVDGAVAGGYMLLYLIGLFVLIGAIVGRSFCGWACPVGTLQDFYSFLKTKLWRTRDILIAIGISVSLIVIGALLPFLLSEWSVELKYYMFVGYVGAIGVFAFTIVSFTLMERHNKSWMPAIFLVAGVIMVGINILYKALDLGDSPLSSLEFIGLLAMMFLTLGILGYVRMITKGRSFKVSPGSRTDWGLRLVKVGPLISRASLSWLVDSLAFTDLDPIGGITATIPELFLDPAGWSANEFFWYKAVFVFAVIAMVAVVDRAWCRYLCPIGAMYGPTNKISVSDVRYDPDQCIHCQLCIEACPMAINPKEDKLDPECIRCGRCVDVCPTDAQKFVLFNQRIKGVFKK